jgi:hypothetical protein
MANAPSISTAARNAACDAVVDLVDAGTPPGLLKIYQNGGANPADVNAALGGATLLATLTMSNPAFGAAANGVATAGAITSDTSADATGTAHFARITNAAGTAIIQMEIGTSGSDLNLSSTAITIGGTVAVSAYTYTQSGS